MQVGIEQICLSRQRIERAPPKVSINTIERFKQYGQLQPVVVRRIAAARYEILANAESWLAAQKAGFKEVAVLVRDDLTDEQVSEIVNTDSTSLDPISEAQWFKSCLDTGWQGGRFDTVTEFARFVDVSRSYVAHALRLLQLPEPIQQAIRIGALRVGHAKALLSLHSVTDQARFSTKIIRGRWSVRRAEYEIRLRRLGASAKADTKSVTTKALERDIAKHLGCEVAIDEQAGTFTINYCRDLDVLDGVLSRFGYPKA